MRLGDDEVLLPGLVDTHVHVNEPGRTEWEGFASATRAAAAGGVTTLVDMPLNSVPPTVDVDALAVKRAAADGQCHVDVGFWGGAVPASLGRLGALADAGVFGFKCFLVDSGVPEFPPLDRDQLERAVAEVAALDALLIVHAEDAGVLAAAPGVRRPVVRPVRGVPPARGRGHGDRRAARPRRPAPGPRPRAAPLQRRRPAVARGGAGRGGAGERRDLPALPDAERGGDPGRAHGVQVLPADPRRRQPGGALGRPDRRDHRLRGVRPLPLDRGPQAPRHRGLRPGLGRGGVPAAGAAADLDRRALPRAGARGRGGLDVHGARGPGRARPEGGDRAGPRRRPRRLRARGVVRGRPGAPAPPQPRHAVRRPPARTAWSATCGCAGAASWTPGRSPPSRPAGCSGGNRHDRIHAPAGPGLARPGRERVRRQRRVLRGAGEPHQARAAVRGAHVRPQGQGVRRLGDPAPTRARGRLGGRAPGRARRGPRRRRRHGVLHRELPAARLGRGGRRRGLSLPRRARRGRLGADPRRGPPRSGTPRTSTPSPTPGSGRTSA